MDIRRIALYAAFAFISYTLWTDWIKEHPPIVSEQAQSAEANQPVLPATAAAMPSQSSASSVEKITNKQAKTIRVKTDVLDLAIDLQQGDLLSAKLLKFPAKLGENDSPIALLQDQFNQRYVAISGLVQRQDQDISHVQANFSSKQDNYRLADDQDSLLVTLEGKTADGVSIKKEFLLKRGSYLIEMRYQLANTSSSPWKAYANTELMRTAAAEDQGLFQMSSYTGASYSIPGEFKYKKLSFKDMGKANLERSAAGGWIAMQEHYFLSAWVPEDKDKNQFYSRANNGEFRIGFVSPAIELAAQATATYTAKLYLGPEETAILKTIAPGLDMTVDYGWLWFLASPIFSLMKLLHDYLGNWGWSIVLVTVLIKLAFYRLSATSYKSMASMRKLEPKLKALRERYGDDKAKISQATMELYRQEKVNPLGGCLPVLIQFPFLIALYWVLMESFELRQAPFVFWIKDLSAADPYHVLPLIMGLSMFVQQRLNPAPPDPTQAKIMMFFPILLTVFFWNFPAGLVLYSIVNNTLSILQQWYITRRYAELPAKPKLAANS